MSQAERASEITEDIVRELLRESDTRGNQRDLRAMRDHTERLVRPIARILAAHEARLEALEGHDTEPAPAPDHEGYSRTEVPA